MKIRARVAGWRCLITSVAGGRILLVIDRNAQRYYRVHQSTRNVPTEIDRETARALYNGAESRRLVPVLD